MTLKAGVDMLKKIDDKTTKNLAKAFVAINSEEECLKFLSDLCTISEIKAMAQRLEVAYMLDNGKVYNDIAAKTAASTATISRVNRALNYGEDGYRIVIDKLGKELSDE